MNFLNSLMVAIDLHEILFVLGLFIISMDKHLHIYLEVFGVANDFQGKIVYACSKIC